MLICESNVIIPIILCQYFFSGTPVVIIEYMAAWIFNNVVPSSCDNISTVLNHSETMLNDILGVCNMLAVDVNMTFMFTTLAFRVKTT